MEISLKKNETSERKCHWALELDLEGKELEYINLLEINHRQELAVWAELED